MLASSLPWPPLLSIVAGTLVFLPGDARWLAASSGLAVLLLCEALARATSFRVALLSGLAFGTVANAVALFSLGPLLARFAGVPAAVGWLIAALAWLLQGLPYGLAAVLARALPLPRWFALPTAVLVSLAVCPQIFPWQPGALQVGFTPFAQLAELGGESLLTACVFVFASCLRERRRWPAALAVLVLPCLFGLYRAPRIEALRAAAPKLKVGVVQSDAGLMTHFDEARARQMLHTLRELTRPLERAGAALTVWGETAYPYPLRRSSRRAPDDVRAALARGVRGPLLVGLETYASLDDDAPKYNSAWLIERGGALGERVDKAQLIPFGEYVPLWHALPPLRRWFRSPGFRAGEPGVIHAAGAPLGVLICYEDLFARSAAASVRREARALINLTNDVWFGDSRVPFLHDTLARLRAIEQRRDLVRAVDTGRSSFTTASGAQPIHTAGFTRDAFLAEVALLSERTVYSFTGDLLTPLCALVAGALWLRKRSAP